MALASLALSFRIKHKVWRVAPGSHSNGDRSRQTARKTESGLNRLMPRTP